MNIVFNTKNAYKMNTDNTGVDLFDTPEQIPAEVSKIFDDFAESDDFVGFNISYDNCNFLLAQLQEIGYTFDYYLTAEPYNLRKIGEQGKY